VSANLKGTGYLRTELVTRHLLCELSFNFWSLLHMRLKKPVHSQPHPSKSEERFSGGRLLSSGPSEDVLWKAITDTVRVPEA
jgi:hypothetical protein